MDAKTMQARDLMTTSVITVAPDSLVRDAARTMLDKHISAVPVVDADGKLVGIVSEGDLLHRAEAGTERRRSWWLYMVATPEALAQDYVKSHAVHVRDVMTSRLVTAAPETPVSEIAELLERRRIKRVPIVSGGKVVGIVSRADILRGVATARLDKSTPGDTAIRDEVVRRLHNEAVVRDYLVNVTVTDGVVHLWGGVFSEAERTAARVAAETVGGVGKVEDHLSIIRNTGAV
jgi:CBS domain-containing protein